jgi:hypothetical protein
MGESFRDTFVQMKQESRARVRSYLIEERSDPEENRAPTRVRDSPRPTPSSKLRECLSESTAGPCTKCASNATARVHSSHVARGRDHTPGFQICPGTMIGPAFGRTYGARLSLSELLFECGARHGRFGVIRVESSQLLDRPAPKPASSVRRGSHDRSPTRGRGLPGANGSRSIAARVRPPKKRSSNGLSEERGAAHLGLTSRRDCRSSLGYEAKKREKP